MDTIVDTISNEVGKPPMDALTGDVMVVLETLRYCERRAAEVLQPQRVPKPAFLFQGTQFRQIFEPHGVALVIAPWNYPFQLSLVPAITALAAGNTVLLKCSEHTPQCAKMIEDLFRTAGLADDVIRVSTASPEETTKLIAAQPDFLFFTGSSRNGSTIARQAAELLIPVVLELGGKDACLVFDSCDLARTIEGVCYGAFSNAGQVCVGTKRIYVQREIFPAFLPAFIQRAQQLRISSDDQADMGSVRLESVRRLLAEQIDEAISLGATLHTHWGRTSPDIHPLILTDVPQSARLLSEESFGPVVCVSTFATEADAIELANSSAFALSSSVFTGDSDQARRVATALQCGSCTVNDVIRSVGNPYAAFGGNRHSGYGRYHGSSGLQAFSRQKTIMEVTHPKAKEVHWFPFLTSTYKALRGLLLLRHGNGSLLKRLRGLLRQS